MNRTLPEWLKNIPVAHRGLHALQRGIPENSLKAFEQAVQAGYAIELDVQVIADGGVVVFHDYNLHRMCKRDRDVHTLTTTELGDYALANTRETIPLLTEVLKLVNSRVPILIEIKRQPAVRKANMVILNTLLGYKGEIAVQSFDPFILKWFAKYAPFVIRGQLASGFKDEQMNAVTKYLLKNLLLNWMSKPDFLAYNIKDLPNARIEQYRKKGMPVLGWTATSKPEHQQANQFCDNIIFESFQPSRP